MRRDAIERCMQIKQSRQVVENFYLRYKEYLFAWIKVSKRSKDKKINMSGDIDQIFEL